MERALGAATAAGTSTSSPSVVIVDGLCDVSGFRYELWCAARAVGASAAVTVCVPGPDAAVEKVGGGTRVVPAAKPENAAPPIPSPYGPPALAASLAARFETPDPANKWEKPLFVVRTGVEGAAGLPGEWREVDWSTVAPAPPAAPAGARAAASRGRQMDGGWPLPAIVAGVVRFVLGGAAATVAPAPEEERASLPLARPSSLTAGISTSAARASGADALAVLDAALQRVVVSVAGHGGAGPLSLDPATGNAEKEGRPGGHEDGEGASPSITLSLPRRPALAELRRHKRDFLRALSGPLAVLPSDGPAAVRAFCAHLKRAVNEK